MHACLFRNAKAVAVTLLAEPNLDYCHSSYFIDDGSIAPGNIEPGSSTGARTLKQLDVFPFCSLLCFVAAQAPSSYLGAVACFPMLSADASGLARCSTSLVLTFLHF